MTVYKGHRVALRSEGDQALYGEHRVVHLVRDILAGNDFGVLMRCGVTTVESVAVEHITSEPLTCLWCVAGVERFRSGFG